MKKAKESKHSNVDLFSGANKIQNDSIANDTREDEQESLISGDDTKSYKKDYDIDV
jgi:hypothetical protein